MSDALTLAIETSNPGSASANSVFGAALADASGAIRGCVALAPRSRHDDALMPAIERLFHEQGVSPADLGRVAVSIGPGGYTSIRIAATTAKMLCEATGAACIGVPTALAVLMNMLPERPCPVTVCLAWKREDVWQATFAPGATGLPADCGLVRIDALTVPQDGILVADAAFLGMLDERLLLPGVERREAVFHPRGVALAAAHGAEVGPERLLPLYPREPEAVSKWAELKALGEK